MSDLVGRPIVRLGMLVAGLCFTAWWAQHTMLDPTRTERIAHVVLDDAEFRDYLSKAIQPAVSRAVPTIGVQTATPAQVANVRTTLATTMARPEIRTALETFLADAHRQLVGQGTGAVTLSRDSVVSMVNAAIPGLSPADIAKIPPVKFDVPRASSLQTAREFLAQWLLPALAAAIVLVIGGLALSRRRANALKIVGRWLIAISLGHVLVLWLIPVEVLPRLTTSPWVHLIASTAKAFSAGVITTLVVMLGVGVFCLFFEHFVPNTNVPDPPSPASPALGSTHRDVLL